MDHAEHTRGFVTIATGRDHYYILARNLLRSCRKQARKYIRFAILCDRENEYTEEFDDVVIMDGASCSYMDKLQLGRYSPYEESIFIDADSLFLGDPAVLWEDFAPMGDFSGYGAPIPLDVPGGWFYYEHTGKFQDQLTFNVQMHGGLYYFRRTETGSEVFSRAIYLAQHYSEYKFAHFTEPADEPVLALSMAVSGCEPCQAKNRICFVPALPKTPKVSVSGGLTLEGQPFNPVILHFVTANTRRFLYTYLTHLLNGGKASSGSYWRIRLRCLPQDIKVSATRVIRQFIKDHVSPETFKKIRMLAKKLK